MATKAEEYRLKAEEAAKAADAARDPAAGRTFREIAKEWIRLAEQFERMRF